MAAKKKDKGHKDHVESPKAKHDPPVTPSKPHKKKEIISNAKVEKHQKKVVSKNHPLAAKAKAKSKINSKKSHTKKGKIHDDPDLDDIVVDEDINDSINDSDVDPKDLDDNFDIESLSGELSVPDDSSDDIVPQSSLIMASSATLSPPEVSTFSTGNYTYTQHLDGTQRVTATVSLADVFRAQGYEVRISS